VDLPDPLRPAIPNHSPEETDNETFSRMEDPSTEKFKLCASNWVITLIGVNDAVEADR